MTPFDEAADLYDEVRPGYPERVIDSVVEMSGIRSGGRILEVGCGTGQITIPFARRGYSIVALEPGPSLARIARANCRDLPDVRVEVTRFEDWNVEEEAFDLVLSAQAFHWVDAVEGLRRADAALTPGGSIALVWSLDRSEETPFYQATEPIYARHFPPPRPGEIRPSMPDRVGYHRELLNASPRFGTVVEGSCWWEKTSSGGDYLKLLDTYSDHRALPEPNKTEFFREIAMVIEEMGGEVTRRFETVVVAAQKIT